MESAQCRELVSKLHYYTGLHNRSFRDPCTIVVGSWQYGMKDIGIIRGLNVDYFADSFLLFSSLMGRSEVTHLHRCVDSKISRQMRKMQGQRKMMNFTCFHTYVYIYIHTHTYVHASLNLSKTPSICAQDYFL